MSRKRRDSTHIPAQIRKSASLEAGAWVEMGTERPTRIGENTWVMHKALIGHDAQIGNNCEIATGSIVGGFAVIEDDVRLGIGTIVKPRVTIGKGARTGCGSVVVSDIPPGEIWAGNPARPTSQS